MVGVRYGVLAVDTAGSVCKKSGMCCEAVDNETQGSAAIVAEEEYGRSTSMKWWDEYGSWE